MMCENDYMVFHGACMLVYFSAVNSWQADSRKLMLPVMSMAHNLT